MEDEQILHIMHFIMTIRRAAKEQSRVPDKSGFLSTKMGIMPLPWRCLWEAIKTMFDWSTTYYLVQRFCFVCCCFLIKCRAAVCKKRSHQVEIIENFSMRDKLLWHLVALFLSVLWVWWLDQMSLMVSINQDPRHSHIQQSLPFWNCCTKVSLVLDIVCRKQLFISQFTTM